MIIAGATDVLVLQARRISRLGDQVLAVLQDRRDRSVGARAEHQRPGTGGVHPLGTVAADQAQYADAGAEPLLRMRTRAQDQIRQRRRVVPDRRRLVPDPLMRPVPVAPMRTRHVLDCRARPVPGSAPDVAGHALAAVEHLHCAE